METKIDWTFITKQEGRTLNGTVPNNFGIVSGKSGVTIGTGFDIGQWGTYQIDKFDISEELKEKLKPWAAHGQGQPFGGQEAYTAYEKAKSEGRGLSITEEEAAELDKVIKETMTNQIVSNYNNAIEQKQKEGQTNLKHFEELPAAAQTIIADVGFNHGPFFGIKEDSTQGEKNLWNAFTQQNWTETETRLQQLKDGLDNRRQDDVKYLKENLTSEKIASSQETKSTDLVSAAVTANTIIGGAPAIPQTLNYLAAQALSHPAQTLNHVEQILSHPKQILNYPAQAIGQIGPAAQKIGTDIKEGLDYWGKYLKLDQEEGHKALPAIRYARPPH